MTDEVTANGIPTHSTGLNGPVRIETVNDWVIQDENNHSTGLNGPVRIETYPRQHCGWITFIAPALTGR